jgi:hypothetical protein
MQAVASSLFCGPCRRLREPQFGFVQCKPATTGPFLTG